MTVRLITTGDKHCPLFNDYLKRLTIDSLVLPGRLVDDAYTRKVLPLLIGHVVTLEIIGRQFSSESFAAYYDQLRECHQNITFVCGPAPGLPPAIKARSDAMISLSPLTFPHELARILLIEQIYRAHKIWDGHPYHK